MTSPVRRPSLGILLIVLATVAMVAAACGSAASPSVSTSPSSSASASASAPASPSAEPSASAGGSPSASTGTGLDLSGSADLLAGIESYRFAISMSGFMPSTAEDGSITMSALVMTADDAAKVEMSGIQGMPAETMTIVVIGDDAWLDMGTGTFVPAPGSAAQFQSTIEQLSPIGLVEQMQLDQFGAAFFKVGDEDKNGVATEHYRVDASQLPPGTNTLGEDAVVEVWIAKDGGYLVSMSLDGEMDVNGVMTPVTMTMDVTNINDPANEVTEPV